MSQFEQAVAFGKYLLLERIGVGGMAEIFTATRQDADERLVIKRILPSHSEDEQFIRMFTEEAKLCEGLRHPNLVEVYDEGEVDGQYFIAMELVDGPDLLQTLAACGKRQIGFPSDLALFIIMEVLRGLEYAHSKTDAEGKPLGIIHRDLSPSNILLSKHGRVKITDFGIAKASSREATAAGVLKGKFGYMAPEQVMGEPLDRRTDIFAVGILLYELLSGHRLFAGKNDLGVLDRIRRADINPPLSHFRPDLDAELEGIVDKALARDPDDRFLTAVALLRALERYVRAADAVVGGAALAEFLRQLYPRQEHPPPPEPTPERRTGSVRLVGFVGPDEEPARELSRTEGELLPGTAEIVLTEEGGATSAGAGPDQEALRLWRQRHKEGEANGLQVSLSEALSSASVPSMSAWSSPEAETGDAAPEERKTAHFDLDEPRHEAETAHFALPEEAPQRGAAPGDTRPLPPSSDETAHLAPAAPEALDAADQLTQTAAPSEDIEGEEPPTAHFAVLPDEDEPSGSLSPEPDPAATAALLAARASTPSAPRAATEAETLHFSLSELPGADASEAEELEPAEPGLGATRILKSESAELEADATAAAPLTEAPGEDPAAALLGAVQRQDSLEGSMGDHTALGDLAEVAALEAAAPAEGMKQAGALAEEGAEDLFGALSALDSLEPFDGTAELSGRTEARGYEELSEELEGSQATRLGLLGTLDEAPEDELRPEPKSATIAAPLLEDLDAETRALGFEHTLDEEGDPPLDRADLGGEETVPADSPEGEALKRGADALRVVVERSRAAKERKRAEPSASPAPPAAARERTAPLPPPPRGRGVFEADTAEIIPEAPSPNRPAPLGRPAPAVSPSPRMLYLLSGLLIASLVVVGLVLASALSAEPDEQGVVEVLDVPMGQLSLDCPSPYGLHIAGLGGFASGKKLSESIPPGSYEVELLKDGEAIKTVKIELVDGQTVKLPCPE